jgi:hypothetical protein
MKVFGMIRVTIGGENVGPLVLFGLFLESAIKSMDLGDEFFYVLNLFGVELLRIFGL